MTQRWLQAFFRVGELELVKMIGCGTEFYYYYLLGTIFQEMNAEQSI